MDDLLIVFAAFLPLIIAFSIYTGVEQKRWNDGTRKVDKSIKKTKLIAVNGVEYVTHKGAVSNALIGHMLAGDIGALAGALSARQVHRENEFTFIVYYDQGEKGIKKEVEKVKPTIGRFKLLVSKLEDDSPKEQMPAEPHRQKTPVPRRQKPGALEEPRQKPRPKANDAAVKVPVGEYMVGEDIPEGAYALTSNSEANIWIYKGNESTALDVSFCLEAPHFGVGRIRLKAGMRLCITGCAISFRPYDGSELRKRMAGKKPALVLRGVYTVGRDIPAGAYTLTSPAHAAIYLYPSEDDEHFTDSYSCDEPDFTIGKIALRNGMKIEVSCSDMTFEPFRGLGFN